MSNLLDFIAMINDNAKSVVTPIDTAKKRKMIIDLAEIAIPVIYRAAAAGNVQCKDAALELEKRFRQL